MKNMTIREFISLNDISEYEAILDHVKPKDSFRGKKLNVQAMPYSNVKYVIRLMQKVDNWDTVKQIFMICFDMIESELMKSYVLDFYCARKHLIREFSRILETEQKLMASQSTDEHLWKLAGGDRLRPYSDTLPLVHLGKTLGQFPFDIGRRPYGEVFSLLAQIKVQNEVENEFQKLKSK